LKGRILFTSTLVLVTGGKGIEGEKNGCGGGSKRKRECQLGGWERTGAELAHQGLGDIFVSLDRASAGCSLGRAGLGLGKICASGRKSGEEGKIRKACQRQKGEAKQIDLSYMSALEGLHTSYRKRGRREKGEPSRRGRQKCS